MLTENFTVSFNSSAEKKPLFLSKCGLRVSKRLSQSTWGWASACVNCHSVIRPVLSTATFSSWIVGTMACYEVKVVMPFVFHEAFSKRHWWGLYWRNASLLQALSYAKFSNRCAFSHAACPTWKVLLVNIHKATSLSSFKCLLRTLLCHDAYKNLALVRLVCCDHYLSPILSHCFLAFPCLSVFICRLQSYT